MLGDLDATTPRHETLAPRAAHKLAHRLDPEKVQQLLTAYQQGAAVKELVHRYKISKTSVLTLLHLHNIAIRLPGRPDEATLRRATKLYEGGLSLLRVSEAVDVPDETLRRYLRERGVTVRRRGRIPRTDRCR
ncbi:MAG TPA: hypothetical protein VNA20_16180 [Frankiaceae bacterium]|nr:hypothetical protein [Frankiaceae bacterium]